MNTRFYRILDLEIVNTNRIHLFLNDEETQWMAYGKSALNLQCFIPELEMEDVNISFLGRTVLLHRVIIGREPSEHEKLAIMCTLLGDDYIELTIPEDMKQDIIF